MIQPLTESQWDPEKYCLTYDKDGNTYELYDEQQILYPVVTCVLIFVSFTVHVCGHVVLFVDTEARNKPSIGAV